MGGVSLGSQQEYPLFLRSVLGGGLTKLPHTTTLPENPENRVAINIHVLIVGMNRPPHTHFDVTLTWYKIYSVARKLQGEYLGPKSVGSRGMLGRTAGRLLCPYSHDRAKDLSTYLLSMKLPRTNSRPVVVPLFARPRLGPLHLLVVYEFILRPVHYNTVCACRKESILGGRQVTPARQNHLSLN